MSQKQIFVPDGDMIVVVGSWIANAVFEIFVLKFLWFNTLMNDPNSSNFILYIHVITNFKKLWKKLKTFQKNPKKFFKIQENPKKFKKFQENYKILNKLLEIWNNFLEKFE